MPQATSSLDRDMPPRTVLAPSVRSPSRPWTRSPPHHTPAFAHMCQANYDFPPALQPNAHAHAHAHRHDHRHSPRRRWTREARRPLTQQERPDLPPRFLAAVNRIRAGHDHISRSLRDLDQDSSRPNDGLSVTQDVARPVRPSTPQSRARLQQVLRDLHQTDTAFQSADPYPSDRPRYRELADPSWRGRRQQVRRREQDMSDRALVQLQEASDRLAQTNEDISASFAAMSRNPDLMPRGMRRMREETFQGHEHNDRRKRRRVGEKPESYPKIEYGYHGQIAAGKLDMEIVYSDGGYREPPFAGYNDNKYARSILQDDKSVYRSEGTPCNIVLRHRGETTFTLERLIIKMPKAAFAEPFYEGLVFTAMDQDDIFERTLKYRVVHFANSYYSTFYPPSSRKHGPQASITRDVHNSQGHRSRGHALVEQAMADLENICDSQSEGESWSFSASDSGSDSGSASSTSDGGSDDSGGTSVSATSLLSLTRLISQQREEGYRHQENFVRDAERRHLGVDQSSIPRPPRLQDYIGVNLPRPAVGATQLRIPATLPQIPNRSSVNLERATPVQHQDDANDALLDELFVRGMDVQSDRAQRRVRRLRPSHSTQIADTVPDGPENPGTGFAAGTNAGSNAGSNVATRDAPTSTLLPPSATPSTFQITGLSLLPPRAYFSMRTRRRDRPGHRHYLSDSSPSAPGASSRLPVSSYTSGSESRTTASNAGPPNPSGDDSTTRVLEFNPPISGRFLMLKLWNPRKEGIVEIRSVEAWGTAGVRWFPAGEMR